MKTGKPLFKGFSKEMKKAFFFLKNIRITYLSMTVSFLVISEGNRMFCKEEDFSGVCLYFT